MWVPEASWPEGDTDELSRVLSWVDEHAGFFDSRRPICLARAPGRLDVMGGIADYSGSLVLELPIAAATWVAVQPSPLPEVVIDSDDIGALGSDARVTIQLADILPEAPLGYERARALLGGDPRRAWAAYVAGALVVLHAELHQRLAHGVRVLVRSEVPVGKGLSSSAAIEVAALEALARLAGARIDDRALALLSQKVENFVVGAPCGVMDQMTSALGRRDHLLEIVCQPAEVTGQVAIPRDLALYGIDSGIRHAVSGADYGTVRAAAFMGYRMVTSLAGIAARVIAPGRVEIADPVFHGYLANVPVAEWRGRLRAEIPEHITGRVFLDRYQGSTDDATTIDPGRSYPVRAATEHAIEEHERVRQFRALLADSQAVDLDARRALGELMFASHASYSAGGLGSEGTDRLVALVRDLVPGGAVYGAKITGGGSGGTVAVLAVKGPGAAAVEAVAEQYREETGRAAAVYAGSSDGARAFGVRRLLPRPAADARRT